MDLEVSLASLQLTDSSSTDPPEISEGPPSSHGSPDGGSPPQLRRSARLKSLVTHTEKKRVLTKPTKVSEEAPCDIENYYLDKRIKRLSPTLETIFEDFSGENRSMSLRKIRRSINFSIGAQIVKAKKRKMMTKRLPAKFRVKNNKKLTLAALFEKLQNVDD